MIYKVCKDSRHTTIVFMEQDTELQYLMYVWMTASTRSHVGNDDETSAFHCWTISICILKTILTNCASDHIMYCTFSSSHLQVYQCSYMHRPVKL